jgi:hypothetical protein
MDLWIPTKQCERRYCICVRSWQKIEVLNKIILAELSSDGGDILPQPRRSSGILEGHPDVEVRTWIWEAEKGKQLSIPEPEWMHNPDPETS